MDIFEKFSKKEEDLTNFPKGFPYYIAGFSDGEASFFMTFQKRPKLPIGIESVASFAIGQKKNDRNEKLLYQIKNFIGCGNVRDSKRDKWLKYEVRSLTAHIEKVIPFFQKYELLGNKIKDFNIFCEICSFMADQQHLNKKGVITILELAKGMNNPSKKRTDTIEGYILF